MRRVSVNIAIIILLFAVQNCFFPFIPFLSAAPNFMLIMVFTNSFIYGEREGMLYGVVVGLLMDLFYSGAFGYYTLIFLWIGYTNGILSRYFYEEYIILPLAICIVNEAAYNFYIYFFSFVFKRKFDILFYLKSIIIPEIIMSLLFTLLMYRLLLIYNRKLEVIDQRRGRDIA